MLEKLQNEPFQNLAGKAGKPYVFPLLWLERLENHRFFPYFGWKTWKAIGFSPALAGKAGKPYVFPLLWLERLEFYF